MLLVILGAGASYDSVPRLPPPPIPEVSGSRPPLANGLFNDRREKFREASERYQRAQDLFPRLQPRGDETSVNVEAVLAEILAEAPSYPARLNQLMAMRFYIRSVISDALPAWYGEHRGVTNQRALLDGLRNWSGRGGFCVVTFNYDTLIENSDGFTPSRTPVEAYYH